MKTLPQKKNYIKDYEFKETSIINFRRRFPELSISEVIKIFEDLKDWLIECQKSPNIKHGMKDKTLDEAWHSFILDTKSYFEFCKIYFGKYIHHIPSIKTSECMDPGCNLCDGIGLNKKSNACNQCGIGSCESEPHCLIGRIQSNVCNIGDDCWGGCFDGN